MLLLWAYGGAIIGIVCFVVHNQLVLHKIETVGLCLVGMLYQVSDCVVRRGERKREREIELVRGRHNYQVKVVTFLTFILIELRHLVNVFAGVLCVGHTKTEIKIKQFEQPVLEEVSLNHPKVFDGLVANRELYPVNNNNKTSVKFTTFGKQITITLYSEINSNSLSRS